MTRNTKSDYTRGNEAFSAPDTCYAILPVFFISTRNKSLCAVEEPSPRDHHSGSAVDLRRPLRRSRLIRSASRRWNGRRRAEKLELAKHMISCSLIIHSAQSIVIPWRLSEIVGKRDIGGCIVPAWRRDLGR